MHPTQQEYNELGFLVVGQDQSQKLHCGATHGALEAEEEDYSEKQCQRCSFRLEAFDIFVKDEGKT
jgi:DNA-directed RNA polymerase subunit RPC12/RpoP